MILGAIREQLGSNSVAPKLLPLSTELLPKLLQARPVLGAICSELLHEIAPVSFPVKVSKRAFGKLPKVPKVISGAEGAVSGAEKSTMLWICDVLFAFFRINFQRARPQS